MVWATAIKSRTKFGTTQNKWIFREPLNYRFSKYQRINDEAPSYENLK
jgi:hypothetical protein